MNKEIDRSSIEELAHKLKMGNMSAEELATFEQWYQSQLEKDVVLTTDYASNNTVLKERMLGKINERVDKQNIPLRSLTPLWKRVGTAAAIILMGVIGVYWWSENQVNTPKISKVLIEDFAPGGNRALLTLADGRQIELTDAKNGVLADQNGTLIKKKNEGEISYEVLDQPTALTNTVTTPRGGQYRLKLSDGTLVWLNAESSISYPTVFNTQERSVKIIGEAYLEVAHNPSKPFKVHTGTQIIEVLGTHFNVSAYQDEKHITTTLLEGSVRISGNGFSKVLKPGQGAIFSANNLLVKEVDISESTAWKDGYFQFVDADIQTVMRQLARWYNIEIVFNGPISQETFTGRISRNRPISQALKMIQASNSVQLTFSERRIMVK